MILQEASTLANGVEIPKLGLGTWLIPNDETSRVVRDAIEIGYRHIDTAQAYANEQGVGEGLRTSGVNRDDVSSPPSWRQSARAIARQVSGSMRRCRRSVSTTLT